MKLAYGSIPKDCGTFTFYRNLRESLRPHGIEVFCVSVGEHEARHWNPAFADDHCVQLAADISDPRRQAMAFVEWAKREGVHFVMPINSTALLAAVPHLPAEMQAVMRCANAFDHGYRITVLSQAYAAAIVGTTPRHMQDLSSTYKADPTKLRLIPHGIDPSPYRAHTRRAETDVLTLGFLGRLEHLQKGALYLPGIVQRLERLAIPYQLKIAGAGEHRSQMEALLAPELATGSVEFVGRLRPQEISGFFADIDVFLFPSRFEGFGFSLVEAMMAGCVPVVSKIDGITDFIIEEGVSGLLCEIGDLDGFARAIARLHGDRRLVRALGEKAAASARARFASSRMGADYACLFRELQSAPVARPATLPWAKFRLPAPLRPTWRSRIPRPIRRAWRAIRSACLSGDPQSTAL